MDTITVLEQLGSKPVDTLIVGMSGIGKSWLARQLDATGYWRYISVDAKIQSQYLAEEIFSKFHEEVTAGPMISRLYTLGTLRLDLEHHHETLAPLTAWLGMPGDSNFGGIPFDEYKKRQNAHFTAERKVIEELLSMENNGHPLLVDTSGSFCEVISIDDPIFASLQKKFRIISLRESDAAVKMLINRFCAHPKPIYYPHDLLQQFWQNFLSTRQLNEHNVVPNEFATWAYEKLIVNRRKKYAAIAEKSNLCIDADSLHQKVTQFKSYQQQIRK